MIRYVFVVLLSMICATALLAQQRINIIPKPTEVIDRPGSFELSSNSRIFYSPGFKDVAEIAAMLLKLPATNLRILGKSMPSGTGHIVIMNSGRGDSSSYTLSISNSRVRINAVSATGGLHGVQSLIQLFLTSTDGKIPCGVISDSARFGYRGLMLDISRNYFPPAVIKKFIDVLSLYKMNRLHLHLTDAAGWRLQIRKYPELTNRAAWRPNKTWKEWWKSGMTYAEEGEPTAYGGYLTQQDARELVRYASKRGITLVPEIEMPGHSEEVIATYPQLGCLNAKDRQGEFCIGTDSTFIFMEDVLTEVMDIFPSSFIHIGGDEAGTQHWKTCPRCQQRMKDNKLKDEKELQSYAIHRMEKFVSSKGRKMIGWDEILEGGLAPGATVMSWRGEKGGIEAARMNHEVIMTPGSYCYFDSYQQEPGGEPEAIGGFLPLKKVYGYEPVPASLEADKRHNVLGAQANVWAEYIPVADHLEYMVFPRVIALSEVVWSPAASRDWTDFQARLSRHYRMLQRLNVNYCRPSDRLDIATTIDAEKHTASIVLSSEQYRPEIRYTTDGSQPTTQSSIYNGPFNINSSSIVRAAIFRHGLMHRKPDSVEIDFHKAIGKEVRYNLPYNSSYPAAKEMTLVNGYRGTLTYQDGQWQGFTNDLDVTIDLGASQALRDVQSTFMQVTGPGVYMPDYVEVFISTDGVTFMKAGRAVNDVPVTDPSLLFKTFNVDLAGAQARFIRFFAKNHEGFLFVDEIRVH